MSSSEIAISMPFAGAMAWSSVALVGAAGYRRSRRWSARVAWIALGALGWSQVATAHLSHGLVVCTALLTAYLVAGAVFDVIASRAAGGRRTTSTPRARPRLALGRRRPSSALPRRAAPPLAGDPAPPHGCPRGVEPGGGLRPARGRDRHARWQRHRLDPGQRGVGRVAARLRCHARRLRRSDDPARRPACAAGAPAPRPGVGVRWCARAHLGPDARRGRHGALDPRRLPAHPVRRRLPAQPRAHALPRRDRRAGARGGRHPGPARRPAAASPRGALARRGGVPLARRAAARVREPSAVHRARARPRRRGMGAVPARDETPRRGHSSPWARCSPSSWS